MAKKIPVLSGTKLQSTFGKFSYTNVGGGRIKIDQAWIDANIVDCVLAKAKNGNDVKAQCHRLAKEPIERGFQMVADKGLSSLIKTYDGLWVPRHMSWKDRKPLSRHSWGIAFDINQATNSYGNGISVENRALNEVFNLFGFAWGGDWSAEERDAMHWELADLDAWRKLDSAPEPAVKALILAVWRGQQYSYHRVASAKLEDGHFAVDRAEIAELLGAASASGRGAVRDVVSALGFKVEKDGDHLSDTVDPRLYLFVKKL